MSDDTQDPAEQGSEETTTPAPWGDDFNAERAWQTISHLRGFEGSAKQFEKLSQDPDALIEFIRDKHPDLLAEAPEEEVEEEVADEYDDPRIGQALTKQAEFERWQAEVERDRATQRFEKDLTELGGEREFSQIAKDWILNATVTGGDNPRALKKAVETWTAYEDSIRNPAEPEPTKRPRAPHVVANGKAATDVPDFSQMSEKAALDWQVERLRGINAR